MYSSTTDPVTATTMQEKYRESCLTRLLMSRVFRRYVECLTVVFFPWVLLTEQEAESPEEKALFTLAELVDLDPSEVGCQINLIDGMHYGPCRGSCKEEENDDSKL